MSEPDLPQPFKRVLHSYFSLHHLEIVAAYMDEREFPNAGQGVLNLRQTLGLTHNDTCADCYCIIKYNGETLGVLLEDKDATSTRNRQVNDALKQLEFTHNKIQSMGLPNRAVPRLGHAFIISAKVDGQQLTTKHVSANNAKMLYNKLGDKFVTIRNTGVRVVMA